MGLEDRVEQFSKRRRQENELIFRDANQEMKVSTRTSFGPEEDAHMPLQFYCECAKVSCRERIGIPIKLYDEIHEHPLRFVVLPGHIDLEIEKVVGETQTYTIVEKIPVEG